LTHSDDISKHTILHFITFPATLYRSRYSVAVRAIQFLLQAYRIINNVSNISSHHVINRNLLSALSELYAHMKV